MVIEQGSSGVVVLDGKIKEYFLCWLYLFNQVYLPPPKKTTTTKNNKKQKQKQKDKKI